LSMDKLWKSQERPYQGEHFEGFFHGCDSSTSGKLIEARAFDRAGWRW
jgi:hypothetical protein